MELPIVVQDNDNNGAAKAELAGGTDPNLDSQIDPSAQN
jgi:hypothetical protein